ncbi:Inosine-5'-monophosphate dehydrogenase,inosine 5'-monophosphate dehydrogenase,L-lactate dehydrogenase (FMN-dependent) and related alpha-hydroxy acid dehydrogenases,inosine-5'-monophosphate dehydrogenase,IMP dehydrogenase / GMP reductase domain [Chlamydia serpentis]|uniref:IMP dehydrogenase/GMP reductase domain-containing protein n=1 Tax=Chlamydia serpentis TaxID=1967782 RepID=A0A2R8FA86_9CHLA|nr:IMP dehydrogenase [Chlamydia serpentis]SPN73333.1 Inosine-5'-monophosphate dehydrogenase,inosine 5'-monophosphate dehydrogenase,L-lactate dehydrogenase (FMN-dependent) and related alpha-hydroxy acid dehydrogenases,inosine-5'-monophosphate dehydrogenase,IMP dehydrogenase / GMP reductase domain [Chlamydia serpentis]
MIATEEALTFDDVLLIPQYSEILPSEVCLKTAISKTLILDIPILSAAMDSVTETDMAIALAQEGGLGILHKNMSEIEQSSSVRKIKENLSDALVGAAIGTGLQGISRATNLVEAGVDVLVIDTAHGHSKAVFQTALEIKSLFPQITLIVGNIVTAEAALFLAEIGVDAVKVGIGPGSICTTRIVSGVGYPQITAIINVAKALKGFPVTIIADGGMCYSGDIVKALAAGAHSVMLGSMLAGTNEAPGEIIYIDEQPFKMYRGMGSLGAMEKGSADRYFQKQGEKKFVPEGVEGLLHFKGPVYNVLYQILGGLRSGMGYLGAKSLQDLRDRASFVRVTQSGRAESHIHNIQKVQPSPNYLIS